MKSTPVTGPPCPEEVRLKIDAIEEGLGYLEDGILPPLKAEITILKRWLRGEPTYGDTISEALQLLPDELVPEILRSIAVHQRRLVSVWKRG